MFTSYDQPMQHDRGSPAGGRSLIDPAYVALRVWRAKWWIAALALLGAAVGVLIALATPKVYHASTQLILDPRGVNLVQNEVTQTPLGLASDAALALIQSQIAVVTSTSVLSQVVDQAGLTQDPEFNGTAVGPLDRLIPSIAFIGGDDPEETVADRGPLTLRNFRENVWAERNANSFVLDVTVESRDPQKAADLANLVAATFVAEQQRAEAELARTATAALSARLVELRERVGDAEEAVERYKAENQLVGVGGRLIDDEFILRINEQLASVRAEITSLNVRAESFRDTSVEDVVDGTVPEELTSPSLVRLRQTFAEVAQENAALAARLGPRHPQRIASEEALATARQAIATELSRVAASAQNELARAQDTERDLTAQIEELRGRQIETSGSFVALRELERDVDASRAIYEAYLLRSREIGEQESLNTLNVRTISPASAPFDPSGPSRKLIVAGGGIVGLGLGLALAIALAVVRLVRMRLAEVPALVPVPARAGFDRPVWTALPPPSRASRGGRRRDREHDEDDEPDRALSRETAGGRSGDVEDERPAARSPEDGVDDRTSDDVSAGGMAETGKVVGPRILVAGRKSGSPRAAVLRRGRPAKAEMPGEPDTAAAVEVDGSRTSPVLGDPTDGPSAPAVEAHPSPDVPVTPEPTTAIATDAVETPHLAAEPAPEMPSAASDDPVPATSIDSPAAPASTPVSAVPAPAAVPAGPTRRVVEDEDPAGRREKLRQRIREIGSRRRIGTPALDEAHVSQAIRRLSRSDRMTIAEIRRRRQQEPDKT